jgi:hypothetical protein
MKNKQNDYLKYWKVVRHYILMRYKISQADLDMMLFLYSEKYFSKKKFIEFNKVLTWDKNRFKNLIENGWISVFRAKHPKSAALYELSYKGQRMIHEMYNKLNGEEISTSAQHNPLFRHDASHGDRLYANVIMRMNEATKRQRLQTPE